MGNNTRQKANGKPKARIVTVKSRSRHKETSKTDRGMSSEKREPMEVLPIRREKRQVRDTEDIRPSATNDRQSARGRLRAVQVGEGLPSITSMMEEIQDMTDVLMGRTQPPIDAGKITLMEVADAYFSRASEMTMLIQKAERSGLVGKGSQQYKFRTGELRTFTEMAKRASDLGSRRLTEEALLFEMSRYGRESKGKIN